jgi:hypothetical protein
MTTPSTIVVGGDAGGGRVVVGCCGVVTVSDDDVDGTVLGSLGGAVASAEVAGGVVVVDLGADALVDVPGAATMGSS